MGTQAPMPPPDNPKKPCTPPPPPPPKRESPTKMSFNGMKSKSEDRTVVAQVNIHPKTAVESAVMKVGVLGVLALLHDAFDGSKKACRFESYKVIQKCLREVNEKIIEETGCVDSWLDREAVRESNDERFTEYGIEPLSGRP